MNELVVLEYPYPYAAWRLEQNDPERAVSERKAFSPERRAVEDYRLCGVYGKAGVPYTVQQADGLRYPELPPHEAIPLDLAQRCRAAIEQGDKLLIASGYCALAPAVVGGIQQALGADKRVGVVWVDAHGDNRIVGRSERQELTFVSFPLSTILGQTMHRWGTQSCGLVRPCRGCDVLVSDARRAGPEEQASLMEAGVRLLDEAGFEDAAAWEEQVSQLSREVDAIFLMVDADIMESRYIPAYFRQEPGGHSVWTVARNVQAVMRTGKVAAFACFCVDFDKYAQGGDVTYLNGMRVIGAGLEAWR